VKEKKPNAVEQLNPPRGGGKKRTSAIDRSEDKEKETLLIEQQGRGRGKAILLGSQKGGGQSSSRAGKKWIGGNKRFGSSFGEIRGVGDNGHDVKLEPRKEDPTTLTQNEMETYPSLKQ